MTDNDLVNGLTRVGFIDGKFLLAVAVGGSCFFQARYRKVRS
ncbi:hypothetical protein [Dactylosporangium sp. NPDC048998]